MCYSKTLADKFFKIDIKDHKKVANLTKSLVKNNEINAVYTQGTDVAFTVSYAAKEAGLNGLDPEVAWATENKILMRKILFDSGIDKTKYIMSYQLNLEF